MSLSVTGAVKRHLLPHGTRLRKLRVGIGKGATVPIDFSQHTRLYLGLYEIELNRYLRAFCARGLSSFDVGGQIGYDALVLAYLTRAPVMSFEADKALAEGMAVTFAANPDVAALLAARHATVGQAEAGPSILALDDVAVSENLAPGIMKIDIDGGELDALRGATRILREARPHLIIETHSTSLERDCALLLRDVGYVPRIVHQRRVLPDHRPSAHNRWLVAEGAPQPGSKLRIKL